MAPVNYATQTVHTIFDPYLISVWHIKVATIGCKVVNSTQSLITISSFLPLKLVMCIELNAPQICVVYESTHGAMTML